MKNIYYIFILSLLCTIGLGCSSCKSTVKNSDKQIVDSSVIQTNDSLNKQSIDSIEQSNNDEVKYQERLAVDSAMLVSYSNEIRLLQDSLKKYKNKPIMNSEQFIQLYKYQTIYNYYKIVKKYPKNSKYLWGWVRRTIEGK